MTLLTPLKSGLVILSTAVLLCYTGISAAESDATKPIDLSKLSSVGDRVPVSIVRSGPIVTIDDFRYSTFRIRGRKIDNSNLNYYVSNGLNSVSTYLGNSPINTNTGPGDFDHINHFERYDIKQVEILSGSNNTFYGNTSLGGIIRYMPNKPVLGESSSHIGLAGNQLSRSGGLGYSGDVTFNVPLADHVAFRFAGGHFQTAGSTDYRNLYKLNDAGEPVNADTLLTATPTQATPTQADFTSQNDVNSFVTRYGRASLLWQPRKDIEARLTHVYQNDKRGGNRVHTLGADGFGVDYALNQSGALIVEPRQRKANTSMLDLSWATDWFALTSNTTLYNHQGSLVDDVTAVAANNSFLTSLSDFCENTVGFGFARTDFCYATPYRLDSSRPLVVLDRSFEDKGATQEFRIESTNNEKLDYVAGLYAHERDRTKNATLDKPGFSTFFVANTPSFHNKDSIQSDRWSDTAEKFESLELATYGNATYKATNKFRVGLGLRAFKYRSKTQVKRAFPMFNRVTFPELLPATQDALRFETISLNREGNDNGILPAFQLAYDMDNKAQLFFDFDKGFRPGGVNTNALLEPNFLTFQSETSYNYELGIRGNHDWDSGEYSRNLHYQVSLFARSGHNQHISTFTGSRDPRDQLQTMVTINADRTQHRGLELKLQGKNGGWGYGLDYVYMQKAALTKDLIQHPSRTFAGATRFDNKSLFDGAYPNQLVVPAGLSTAPFVLARSGTNIPFTPKHSLVLKSNYLINRDAMSINLFGSIYAQSDTHISLTDSNRLLPSYTILNAGVGFLWDSRALYLFVNNIANQKGAVSEETANAGPSKIQNVFSSGATQGITQPRLMGITFTIDF